MLAWIRKMRAKVLAGLIAVDPWDSRGRLDDLDGLKRSGGESVD